MAERQGFRTLGTREAQRFSRPPVRPLPAPLRIGVVRRLGWILRGGKGGLGQFRGHGEFHADRSILPKVLGGINLKGIPHCAGLNRFR